MCNFQESTNIALLQYTQDIHFNMVKVYFHEMYGIVIIAVYYIDYILIVLILSWNVFGIFLAENVASIS
jgi:hypothetical protein